MNDPIPPIRPLETKSAVDNSMVEDADHLRLLSIFHYILSGLTALCSMFPIIHLTVGLFMVFGRDRFTGPGQSPPPAIIGFLFVIMACVMIAIGLTLSALMLFAGRGLSQRKRYNFCFVMACIECLFMPFGTVLGVFTIVVLNRRSVKQLFGVEGNS